MLHELSDDARAVGAVNTVVLRNGRRIGHNTDGWGFAAGFRQGLVDMPRQRVVQLGAGGAGSAVSHAALGLGVGELAVYDIEPDRAVRLVNSLTGRFGSERATVIRDLATAVKQADGLIHCTPTGMVEHSGLPLPAELLRPTLWIAEIVYFPLETELLRRARAIGCRTLGGGGMAVFQAVRAFHLFTGIEPDAVRMRNFFEEAGAIA